MIVDPGYKTNDITKLAVKRAQDQESVTGYDLPTAYGNFLHIHQSNNAIFNSNTSERILLHSSNTITNTLTQIGEAYVKNIEYVSGDGFDAVHKLHLFGVKRSGANNLPLNSEFKISVFYSFSTFHRMHVWTL